MSTDWKQYHNPDHYRFARSIEGYHPPPPKVRGDRIVFWTCIIGSAAVSVWSWLQPGAM